MKFLLKRRLNPFLLLTTVIGLSLLVGLSIIYQTQFDEVTSERQNLQEELNQVRENLNNTQQRLNATRGNEEQLQEQISELESQLQNRSQSTESLEQRITELENQTQTLKESRNEYREDLSLAKSNILQICRQEENLNENSTDICGIWERR